MRGLILAGGSGTRLRPLTQILNKNLIPVGGRLMLEYPLMKMAEAGIKEVCIVSGVEHIGMVIELCKSGASYGLDLTYRVQEAPKGIAHGIGLARNFARNDDLLVILGDNLFDASLKPIVDYHNSHMSNNAFVLVKEVSDPCRFGVVEYDDSGKIKAVIEKPVVAPSNDVVIGVYCYPPDVFDKIDSLKPSARGEYEVTDLTNMYLQEGKLRTHKIEGFWIDAGTKETLKLAQEWGWKKEL
jgi:glucose-1-phosphate thymidylyltransferase